MQQGGSQLYLSVRLFWILDLLTMDMSDEKLRRIAFHEAGHAWMMVFEGLGVRSVSLEIRGPVHGDNRGETVPEVQMSEGRRDLSEKFARAALAGSAAEHFLMGGWDEESLLADSYDRGRAKGFMAVSGNDWKPEALDHYIQALANSVVEEISTPRTWHAITCLAFRLMAKGAITGVEIAAFIEENWEFYSS